MDKLRNREALLKEEITIFVKQNFDYQCQVKKVSTSKEYLDKMKYLPLGKYRYPKNKKVLWKFQEK